MNAKVQIMFVFRSNLQSCVVVQLDAAIPAFEEAVRGLDTLNKDDIVRCFVFVKSCVFPFFRDLDGIEGICSATEIGFYGDASSVFASWAGFILDGETWSKRFRL